MRTRVEVKKELDELTVKRDELAAEADALKGETDLGHQERRHRLIAGSANVTGQIEALRKEYSQLMLRAVEDNPYMLEGPVEDSRGDRRADESGPPSARTARSQALRTIERHRSILSPQAGDRLDAVIRDPADVAGIGARYLAAVGNESYRSAFWRLVRDPNFGHLEMSPAETDAIRTVRQVEQQRAMSLTGSAGGFAVPLEIDPSIVLTSAGAVDPLRQIANVKTIATDEWRGVTSAGITAAYAAEATETSDNAPTLVQPTISTEKAQAFVPFSIEVGMDWSTMESELGAALADAKNTLESSKFTTGTGTNEPFGVITGATTTVNATGAGVFDAEDLYRLTDALPARHQARASYVASGTILNKIAQFETAGGALQFPEVRDGRLLRKPLYENSSMATVTTVGALFAIYGDFSRFVIVDRIGMSVELVPHLFGTNHRPTGQRGLYAYWRNSSKVIDAGAFRVLIGLA